MENLPPEIWFIILPYLPLNDVLRLFQFTNYSLIYQEKILFLVKNNYIQDCYLIILVLYLIVMKMRSYHSTVSCVFLLKNT